MGEMPTQVQRQAEEAERLAKQLAGEPEAEPQEGAESSTQEGQPSGQQTEPSEDFEQKYRTLQGMFNAETSKMRSQLADREEEIKSLQAQLAERQAEPQEKVEFGTEDDINNFGADFVEMVERGVKARTSEQQREIAELKAQIASMTNRVERVDQDANASRFQAYMNELDQLYPDWRRLNNDSGFLEWLKETDELSGIVRNDLLQKYNNDMNARQVATIFKAYGAATPQQPKQPTLANQVSPSRGHPTAAPSGKPVYTEAQVKDFYDAVRRHYYTDEQANAIEKEIELAYAEGRIVS